MFISTTRIFALVAVLASSTFALPEGGLDRREAAEVNRVKLQVGEFMGVESPAKSDSIKGWGGIGDRFWNFAFQGTYNKENYVYTLYKKEGTWDSNDASPNQPVNKKFDVSCYWRSGSMFD